MKHFFNTWKWISCPAGGTLQAADFRPLLTGIATLFLHCRTPLKRPCRRLLYARGGDWLGDTLFVMSRSIKTALRAALGKKDLFHKGVIPEGRSRESVVRFLLSSYETTDPRLNSSGMTTTTNDRSRIKTLRDDGKKPTTRPL